MDVPSEGHANLAPFSFFTVVCLNPPHVLLPIGRLAGASYARVTNVLDLVRSPSLLRPER